MSKAERSSQYQPKESLRRYFGRMKTNYGIEVAEPTVQRIEAIVERNNQIGQLLSTPEYKRILDTEKELKGDAKLAGIICIDGRFDTIHPFGRTINVWEEPASLAGVRETEYGLRPESFILLETLRAAAKDGRDLLEVVFAHTSSTTLHKCGRMQAGAQKGEFDDVPGDSLEEKNIALFESRQIPAITNAYNYFRAENGLVPLQRVAISALYDTDTMGVSLSSEKNHFSTTEWLRANAHELEQHLTTEYGAFGSMRQIFSSTEHFLDFSQRVVGITQILIESEDFKTAVRDFVIKSYSDLTQDQQKALLFLLARTTAAQYLTGLAYVPETGPDHPFSAHQEDYMSVAHDGKPMGRFDPEQQSFGSSPSTVETATEHVKTKLSLLDRHRTESAHEKPDILFVTKLADKKLWNSYITPEGDMTMKRALADLDKLYYGITRDPNIRERIKKGELIIIPAMVDQETGEILSVIDESYFFA